MRGLISDPTKTMIGKTDFSKMTSKIRVIDSKTLVLEVKNDPKVYVNNPLNWFEVPNESS